MEKEKQFYKELPTGTGRESEPKETLPAVEVKNEVIWVNPDFPELPFNIKEGESTKLGMFLTPKPKEEEKSFDLRVKEGHKRSALLGRVIFQDKQGRLYRDIDLKGIGHIISSPYNAEVLEVWNVRILDNESSSGILDRDWAEYARDMSEKFLKAGIRTERYIALIKLNEIIDENREKITIEEAKNRKMINQKQEPMIALRAFGTKFRIEDVAGTAGSDVDHSTSYKLLTDAKRMIAQELGIKDEKFSFGDYLKWFAKTIGKNIALMHKNKWCHKGLSQHNITLDCRVVDLDSVTSIHKFIYKLKRSEKKSEMFDDYDLARGVLLVLFEYCSSNLIYSKDKFEEREIKKIFNDSYVEILDYDPKFLERRL